MMLLAQLLPPGVNKTSFQRLRLRPHDGTETPERLQKERAETHGSMTLADGKTPMRIVTLDHTRSPSGEPQSTKVHLFTTAPRITVIDRNVVFEGKHSPNSIRPRKNKPPDSYVPTSDLPKHLKDWSFLGTPVCTMGGKTEVIAQNMAQHLLRYPQPGGTQTFGSLSHWPLERRSLDTLDPTNWALNMEPGHLARNTLVTTVVMMSWLQTWGLLMGRFMRQHGASRQTWPLLFRYHELTCKVFKEAKVYTNKVDHRTQHMVSPEIERCFPTWIRLSQLPELQRVLPLNAAEVTAHQNEWLAFLATHSFSDALFAWFYFNHNDVRMFKTCSELRRKIHQLWLTRHFVPHEWDTITAQTAERASYAVIQGKAGPRVRLPTNKNVSNFEVLALSHPVVRPGLPLFSSPVLPLDALLQPRVQELFGAKAFVEALSAVWDVALCMTVADQRAFFRVMFTAHGGGLFSQLMELVSHDVTIT